jgi:hypothetical protein
MNGTICFFSSTLKMQLSDETLTGLALGFSTAPFSSPKTLYIVLKREIQIQIHY